jgi:NADPH2:quinone reductase
MKAIVIDQFGGPEVLKLKEVPDPEPGPGQVVVGLAAAGVNPVETYMRSGTSYRPPLPFTPGSDGAGVIEAVGDGVTQFSPGDRVYTAGSLSGTYAEKCLCTASQVHPLPSNLDFDHGASLWINYGTAYRALFQRGSCAQGDVILIHGASGGVGVAAVQFAMHRGIVPLGTYGSEAGHQLLADLGVKQLFNHNEEGYAEEIRKLCGEHGIDLIVEMLANVNLDTDMKLLASGGTIVIVGSRGEVTVAPRDLMRVEGNIKGLMLAGATDAEIADIHSAIADAAGNGAIRPVIQERIPLAEAARAHSSVIESPSHGKILLIP